MEKSGEAVSTQRDGLGRSFRTLNVLDDFNREGQTIELDFSLSSKRVVRTLNHIINWRGRPDAIRVDNGGMSTQDLLDSIIHAVSSGDIFR